jgi:hypothetical protein
MPVHYPHTTAVRIQRAWRTFRPSAPLLCRPAEIRGGRRRRGRRVPRARTVPRVPPLPFPRHDAPPGRLHGWYSRKHSDHLYRLPIVCASGMHYEVYLGGGETVQLTEVTTRPVHWCSFDDVEYRGLVTRMQRLPQ